MSSSPPRPVRIASPRRSTPHLKEYLEFLEFKSNYKGFFITSIVAGSIGAVGALVSVILVAAGALGPGTTLWVLTNVFGAFLLAGAGGFWWLRRNRPKDPNPAIVQEARGIGEQLKQSLIHNRLHREMHPSAIALIEEAAHCWKRIQETTDGSYWSSADLPAHYQAVRDQARSNADQAMMEVLLHLRSAIKPVGQPKTLVEGLQTMLDAIGVSLTSVGGDEPLPEGFTSAAIVAKSLSELAAEIEQTSIRAVTTSSATADSGESIRKTLEDLRQIRVAESELDDELHLGS